MNHIWQLLLYTRRVFYKVGSRVRRYSSICSLGGDGVGKARMREGRGVEGASRRGGEGKGIEG